MASVPSVLKFAPVQTKHTRLKLWGVFSLVMLVSPALLTWVTMVDVLGAEVQVAKDAATVARTAFASPTIFPDGGVGFRFHCGVTVHISTKGVPLPGDW